MSWKDKKTYLKQKKCLGSWLDFQLIYDQFFFCRLKEKDVILQKMHTVESDYKSQVSKLESDLEDQRAKNNVSRLLQ